jgi:hypothetical protein
VTKDILKAGALLKKVHKELTEIVKKIYAQRNEMQELDANKNEKGLGEASCDKTRSENDDAKEMSDKNISEEEEEEEEDDNMEEVFEEEEIEEEYKEML